MNPLRHTPLHPQWLVLRRERTAFAAAGAALKGRVLDIGCADKPLRPHLNDEVQYLGLDYYATAKQLYDTQPDVYGDGQCLPFADESFDGVALLDVLEHLPNPEASIAEIERVLVPGGVLALQVPFVYPLHDAPFDFQRWTRYGLTRLLAVHGFELLSEDSFGHPLETAALLGNIALARTVMNLVALRNPVAILVGAAALVLIPLRNISGWLFAQAGVNDEIMPFGYRLVCQKGAEKNAS